jgi:Xaa-Pro aminopeptidase
VNSTVTDYSKPMSATREEFARRLTATADAAKAGGIDAVLVTPGADLTYLCGYEALPLERLTCLAIPATGKPFIVVPELETLAAQAAGVGELGIEILPWPEVANPHQLLAEALGPQRRVALNPQMWAAHVFAFQAALPATTLVPDTVLALLRMRKSPWEISALQQAGATIDRVHQQVPTLLRVGRTEREVAADIAELIITEGHETVDFVIVASGPNGASPHHEVSDRVIQAGDPVVVDIGGTMPSGYCSDSTRTYCMGEPPAEYVEAYAILQQAQAAATSFATVGVTCEAVDAAARDVLTEGGLGQAFVHRTGHGIGMSTHEEPYIVQGNDQPVETGFAFSVEPGFYLPGKYGARIEDIVVVTDDGAISCNNTSHDLVIVTEH